jgi:RNA polymerase sigma-70 factor (family 1)
MNSLPNNLDNKLLFDLVSKGNENAFKVLFEKYKGKTYAVAYKCTRSSIAAEEITQEVFISIWISKLHLPFVKDPEAYIYTVIYNNVKGYIRKEYNQNLLLQTSFLKAKQFSNETEETILANESQHIINEALSKLTPQKKLIYNLSRQQGRSYSEIGEALHLSPHTVKSHLSQTVKFIRKYFENIAILITAGTLFLPLQNIF